MIAATRVKLTTRDSDPLASSEFVAAWRGSSLMAAPLAVPSLLKTISLPPSIPPRHKANIPLNIPLELLQ